MLQTDSDGNEIVEREMTRNQRGLVDTCFEEGQYEAAISVLDQLRSVKYRPSTSHIRQLLCVALYPPPTNDGAKERAGEFDPVSPRKAAKQQRAVILPSTAASAAAQRLLMLFAHTNLPGGIFCALPSYSATEGDSKNVGGSWDDDDEEDSYIAREALRVRDSKDCWSILRVGFIQRKQTVTSTAKSKGKRRARERPENEDSDDSDDVLPTIIAEHAWPVLNWFLTIFERDESLTEHKETPRYSPLLLSQIPAPRGESKARWEIDTPLEIVFHCLKQTEERRRDMGARLMTLLINLTSTIYLDMPMFVSSVVGRLLSSSADEFSTLFSRLAPSAVIIRSKVALCQRYITQVSFNSEVPSDSRPKPQPRAVRSSCINAADDTVKPTEPETTSTTIASKHSLPPSSEILRLMEKNLGDSRPSPAVILSFRVKFELLVAYGIAQGKVTAENKDPEWSTLLRDGKLADAVSTAFSQEDREARAYREALLNIIAAWRQSL